MKPQWPRTSSLVKLHIQADRVAKNPKKIGAPNEAGVVVRVGIELATEAAVAGYGFTRLFEDWLAPQTADDLRRG